MSNIAIIYMGGTLGCVGSPLSPMPEAQFIPHLKSILTQHSNLAVDCFAAPEIIDSSACTAKSWLLLIQLIQNLQTQHYQKFIIIHGTDTLSYASAVLARFLSHSCCVILTGSQHPLLDEAGLTVRQNTDALDNLLFTLQEIQQQISGVYLSFANRLYHARSVIKCHTTQNHAFEGISAYAPLLDLALKPTLVHQEHIEQAQQLKIFNCMLQPLELTSCEQLLKSILSDPPHFLILQGFGTGNVPVNAKIIHQLQQLKQQGCLSVITTQVTFGAIDQRYAVSAWIKDAQIIATHTLGHADLYAKILQLYLQYPDVNQWYAHWFDDQI